MATIKEVINRLDYLKSHLSEAGSCVVIIRSPVTAEAISAAAMAYDPPPNVVVLDYRAYRELLGDSTFLELYRPEKAPKVLLDSGCVGTINGLKIYTTMFLDQDEEKELNRTIGDNAYVFTMNELLET